MATTSKRETDQYSKPQNDVSFAFLKSINPKMSRSTRLIINPTCLIIKYNNPFRVIIGQKTSVTQIQIIVN